MAKVKSIIMEKDIGFLSNTDVHFVSLVGHAANRQPFKIIKGEVIKGDKDMTKQTIYKVLVKKGVTDNKLQELMTEHKFSVDQKDDLRANSKPPESSGTTCQYHFSIIIIQLHS